MDSALQDLRYAMRLCLRTPGFTTVAVVALALGIGANTAIFTLVHAVLIERLPYRDPGQIVVLWETNARRPGRPNTVAPANFIRWGERATAFESIAAYAETRINLTEAGDPEELVVQNVTAPFFSVLGVSPMIGRVFTHEESADPESSAVVLSYDLWQRRFGADPSIVGKPIRLNTALGAVRAAAERARASRPVSDGDSAPEAGSHRRRGARADEHDCGEPRGRAPAVRYGLGHAHRPAARRACRRAAAGAARAVGRGRVRPAHRVRQRGQPPARARRRPAARDRHTDRARRAAASRDPPAAHREPDSRRARRCGRTPGRPMEPRPPPRAQPGRSHVARPRRAELSRAVVHGVRVDPHRNRVWVRARVGGVSRRRPGNPQGRRAANRRRRAPPASAAHVRHGGDRARRRPARGGRPHAAQLQRARPSTT
ncbi:MAG: hypothetical protein DMF96_30710 [Acidobacteria bacterium]|nr:MAG: hypothetical protein DMF96_30710 [Acidobacteriota bacterium]